MTFDTLETAVEIFCSSGVRDFRLTGGEPTSNREFMRMLEHFISKDIRPRLITNGVRLMRMKDPDVILGKLSRCWVSVYGIDDEQHRKISGRGSPVLPKVLDFVGQQAALGNWIGVSALLTDVRLEQIDQFLAQAAARGVRNLRFIFGEKTGRASATEVHFEVGAEARSHALRIVDQLRERISRYSFEFVSINNPMDLDSRSVVVGDSCMLASRGMWSISPEGKVYSCCFNIDDAKHLVTTDLRAVGRDVLQAVFLKERFAPACKGLAPGFWGAGQSVTCPISALTIRDRAGQPIGSN